VTSYTSPLIITQAEVSIEYEYNKMKQFTYLRRAVSLPPL